MGKFIQTHFFHPFTFPLPTKQKWRKLKYFLSFHLFTPPTKQTLSSIPWIKYLLYKYSLQKEQPPFPPKKPKTRRIETEPWKKGDWGGREGEPHHCLHLMSWLFHQSNISSKIKVAVIHNIQPFQWSFIIFPSHPVDSSNFQSIIALRIVKMILNIR